MSLWIAAPKPARDDGFLRLTSEAAQRLHPAFPLLSDERSELAGSVRLPIFEASGMTLLKRVTPIIDSGTATDVFCPVFPPYQDTRAV